MLPLLGRTFLLPTWPAVVTSPGRAAATLFAETITEDLTGAGAVELEEVTAGGLEGGNTAADLGMFMRKCVMEVSDIFNPMPASCPVVLSAVGGGEDDDSAFMTPLDVTYLDSPSSMLPESTSSSEGSSVSPLGRHPK